MRVVPLVASESVSLDNFTNRLSVFHILDEINSVSFPVIIPSLCICFVLEKQPDDVDPSSAITKVTLDDAELASFPANFSFNDKRLLRVIQNISGFVVQSPGLLRFALDSNGEISAAWTVRVSRITPPSTAESGTGAAADLGVSSGRPSTPAKRKVGLGKKRASPNKKA